MLNYVYPYAILDKKLRLKLVKELLALTCMNRFIFKAVLEKGVEGESTQCKYDVTAEGVPI